MRDYAKTGGKVGKPAYRTPSSFLAKKNFLKNKRPKPENSKIFVKKIEIASEKLEKIPPCRYGRKKIELKKRTKLPQI
jgi:hypothetical protein